MSEQEILIRIHELSACLTDEADITGQMIETALEKKKVIVTGDVKTLNTLMRKEAILLQNLNKTEVKRVKAQQGLEGLLGNNEGLTAAQLIERLSGMDKKIMDDLKAKVKTLAFNFKGLKQLNEQNAELINDSLAYIELLEEMIGQGRDTTYEKGGISSGYVKDRKILDKKI